MPLPLHERATEDVQQDLVRLTLTEIDGGTTIDAALIPDRPLEAGEQYRFHFDMTRCIGCRSCEIACNEQNGNPAEIKWRRVGELEGGVYPFTQRTYLSMGCNHCLSADCLRGCPVDAYSKDPVTGIVLHSADACIGCQYCVWNCPYSVPQFNPERGVVGKCDMCRGRLLDGLEPACVNACPEGAIAIEIVNKAEWRENFAAADSPGLPPAGQTISTTRITLPEDSTSWLERVDTGVIGLEPAHSSLIAMTTIMQAAFGTLTVLWLRSTINTATTALLLLLTIVGVTVSVFHLGRPAYAWRALKMWRRSWLSREVLCFTLFFASVAVCSAASLLASAGVNQATWIAHASATAAVLFGLCGTVASAFIYCVKARPAWNMVHTPADFLLSAGLLGSTMIASFHAPTAALIALLTPFGFHIQQLPFPNEQMTALWMATAWLANTIGKVARLRRSTNFESRASYNLLRGESLWWVLSLALFCAAATPLFLSGGLSYVALITSASAVVLGRYLFFVSVVPLSMGLTFSQSRRLRSAAHD